MMEGRSKKVVVWFRNGEDVAISVPLSPPLRMPRVIQFSQAQGLGQKNVQCRLPVLHVGVELPGCAVYLGHLFAELDVLRFIERAFLSKQTIGPYHHSG